LLLKRLSLFARKANEYTSQIFFFPQRHDIILQLSFHVRWNQGYLLRRLRFSKVWRGCEPLQTPSIFWHIVRGVFRRIFHNERYQSLSRSSGLFWLRWRRYFAIMSSQNAGSLWSAQYGIHFLPTSRHYKSVMSSQNRI